VITNSKMVSLWKKLRNKKFRDAFVASQFKRSIPFQITALRNKLGLSQEQLARASHLTQGVISRSENPNYGNLTFNTVLRIAAGLDVAVIVEFVPFSKLLEVFENRSEDQVPIAFEAEDTALASELVAPNRRDEQTAIRSALIDATQSAFFGQVNRQRQTTPFDRLGTPTQLTGVQSALQTQQSPFNLGYAN
jgi:transcriptional regulator with XRE-family HTH domain